MKVIGVIPARLESQRLFYKMTEDICGLPMFVHTCKRAQLAETLNEVYLATDSKLIANIAKYYNIKVILTGLHTCGSNRIAEAVKDIDCDIVVNIQGDEPLVYPEHIDKIAEAAKYEMFVLGYTKYTKKNSLSDIKAVLDKDGYILYCSRNDIPSDAYNPVKKMNKLCFVVAFWKVALLQYSSWKQTPLEIIEKNEYLRILENGYKIKAVEIEDAKISVDTYEDLEIVKELMEKDTIKNKYIYK